MLENHLLLISLLVFLPVIGAAILILPIWPKEKPDVVRFFTLLVTLGVLAITFFGVMGQYDIDQADMQLSFAKEWIPAFDIEYFMGMDGISFPLILLTSVVTVLAMGASWSIKKHIKAYCVLFLLLQCGMLGVFLALDLFLFYIFWEVMLLPMYFLIGVWGGPRKEYAAIKFFLFTLAGSVFMLIAILMLYFNSDLTKLNKEQLIAAHVVRATEVGLPKEIKEEAGKISDAKAKRQFLLAEQNKLLTAEIKEGTRSRHTFNILALQQMGQHTTLFSNEENKVLGCTIQFWAFVLLFLGFAIKVPTVPVHTWLPDAHVEAPTPISMILAGVLLKMGGYGIIRICYPICPEAGFDLAWWICGIGVLSMVYGGFAALAQTDFKRMVAYSSVSHMGYVVLGLGVWSAAASNGYNHEYWLMGVKGAMFQMIAHGVSSAGMFFMVGIIYDRVHHRNLNEFGGIFGKMPAYTAVAMLLFFAGLGLPGLCGFIGEVLVVLSIWNFSKVLAVVSAFVVIITAAYILWAIQRVYLGAEYKGPHAEEIKPINTREMTIAIPLCILAIVLGIFPHQTMFKYMDKSLEKQVIDLTTWQKGKDQEAKKKQAAEKKQIGSKQLQKKPAENQVVVKSGNQVAIKPGVIKSQTVRQALASP